MANGQRFIKFYPTDWNTDVGLKMCSPINQYLWFQMLLIAAQHEPPGFVAVNNRTLNADDIARIIGWDIEEVKAGIVELEKAEVFSRLNGGMIYSRRMVRDDENYKKAVSQGRKGGNPLLLKAKSKRLKPPHKLEAEAEAEAEGRKRPSQKGSFSSVQEGSETETPHEQGAARVASLEVASLPRPPTFEEFKAAYPFNWGEASEHDQKIYLERWRDLDDDEKRLAVSEIPKLLAWVNEAPSDPERMVFYPETWLGARHWTEVWRRAPHLNPNARIISDGQPESENAA
jgi:hypothetical protein